MAIHERYLGKVKTLSMFGRAGTIEMADGREVLFRYSAVRGTGVRHLDIGATVSFSLEEQRRGVYAVCVEEE